jgi:hypothetical protein
MKPFFTTLVFFILVGGVAAADSQYSAPILLPDYCNTPDALEILDDQSVIVSVPNFTDDLSPGVLVKIDPANQVSLFWRLPKHPKTGKVYPMGIRQAKNGDLYTADCQILLEPNQSRVLRVVMKDGRPQETIVVARGLNCANGVAVRGDWVYVTDSITDATESPIESGLLRFGLDERDVELKLPLRDDPHFVASWKTKNKVIAVGADGITVDSRGNLIVANCGDGELYKVELDEAGNVKSNRLFVPSGSIVSADGIYCDRRDDTVYVADVLANAIRAVSADGTVRTVCENGDTDGADGSMDGPSEAIVRGDELIISNFDRVFPGAVNTKPDKPYTMSIFKLKK